MLWDVNSILLPDGCRIAAIGNKQVRMNFIDKIGNLGRMLGGHTTYGGAHLINAPRVVMKGAPTRVLICRPNHRLGNLLLITPIIQEVSTTFPDCKIDLFVKGKLGQVLFRNYPNVDRIIQLPKRPFQNLLGYIKGWLQIRKNRYDIAINVDQSSSSGRLSVQFANSGSKVLGNVFQKLATVYKDYEHHAKFPVYNFWSHLERNRSRRKYKYVPGLDLRLEPSEIADGKKILRDVVGNGNPTICLYTYATGKKCYPAEWWIDFYEKLKANFPQVNIIEILPLHKAAVLSSWVETFYSTDVRQIGSVIANSALFIGADCGIMHLASSVQTPTVGFFSVTEQSRYEPYNNGSIGFNTNNGDIDECLKKISSILVSSVAPHHVEEKAIAHLI